MENHVEQPEGDGFVMEHRPKDTPRMNAAEDLAVQLTANRCAANVGLQKHDMVHFGEADRWAVVVEEGRKLERELAIVKKILAFVEDQRNELLRAPHEEKENNTPIAEG